MKPVFVLGLALSAFAAPALSDVIGPGGKVQDCYCTDSRGSRVELGETICLQVDGRMFMAQCQMSLNVPMWREVQEGCLSSRLSPGLTSGPAPLFASTLFASPPFASPLFATPLFATPPVPPPLVPSQLLQGRDPALDLLSVDAKI